MRKTKKSVWPTKVSKLNHILSPRGRFNRRARSLDPMLDKGARIQRGDSHFAYIHQCAKVVAWLRRG